LKVETLSNSANSMKRNISKISALLPFLFSLWLIAACNLGKVPSTPIPTASDTPSPITPLATTTPLPAGDLGWGSIRGKVTDAVTGAPIVNAKVTCTHYSYTSPVRCQGDTFTDEDGTYSFINIFFHDTDKIHLWVNAPGYEPIEFKQFFFTFPELISDFALSPTATIITPAITPMIMCTPPLCAIGTSEVYCCSGNCPGGCGTTCATYTPAP
jgi:hypothetical protein